MALLARRRCHSIADSRMKQCRGQSTEVSMMLGRIRRRSTLATCMMTVLCFTNSSAWADGPTREPQSATTPDAEIASLLSQLSSPNWSVREIATVRLERFGPSIYDELREAYRQSEDFESRHRIKRIAYEIHLNERVGPVRAFLGIQHSPADITCDGDGRVPPGATGLLIRNIVPGSAAAMVGMRGGDLLLGLNGELSTLQRPATMFVSWIGDQLPGTVCTIRVFRGGEGRVLSKARLPGFDARAFQKAKVEEVLWEADARLPDGAAGLKLVDATRMDSRLELESGDLIVALDGALLSPGTAAEQLTQWAHRIKNAAAQDDADDEGGLNAPRLQIVAGNMQVIGGGIATSLPSIQIMRGGEVIEFEVTLLARPANLDGGRAFQRKTTARAVREAEATFDVIWSEQFQTVGRTSDRIDGESMWRLE